MKVVNCIKVSLGLLVLIGSLLSLSSSSLASGQSEEALQFQTDVNRAIRAFRNFSVEIGTGEYGLEEAAVREGNALTLWEQAFPIEVNSVMSRAHLQVEKNWLKRVKNWFTPLKSLTGPINELRRITNGALNAYPKAIERKERFIEFLERQIELKEVFVELQNRADGFDAKTQAEIKKSLERVERNLPKVNDLGLLISKGIEINIKLIEMIPLVIDRAEQLAHQGIGHLARTKWRVKPAQAFLELASILLSPSWMLLGAVAYIWTTTGAPQHWVPLALVGFAISVLQDKIEALTWNRAILRAKVRSVRLAESHIETLNKTITKIENEKISNRLQIPGGRCGKSVAGYLGG